MAVSPGPDGWHPVTIRVPSLPLVNPTIKSTTTNLPLGAAIRLARDLATPDRPILQVRGHGHTSVSIQGHTGEDIYYIQFGTEQIIKPHLHELITWLDEEHLDIALASWDVTLMARAYDLPTLMIGE